MLHDRQATADSGSKEVVRRPNARRGIPVFRWIGRLVRLGRLAAFTSVVTGAVLFGWVGVVRGAAEKRAVVLGRELASVIDVVGGAHRVTINGQSIYIGSSVLDEPVKSVLDRFENHCMSESGGFSLPFESLSAAEQQKLQREAPQVWAYRMGVLRDQSEDGTEGTVMCLAQKGGGGGLTGLIERFAAFEESGELGKIGEFRHVYVRKTDTGGSHVISSFTQGKFNVREVFSEDEASESPMGIDPPNTPRPPRSFRLLSATVDDEPFGVQIFETAEPMERINDLYEHEMPARGWVRMAGHHDVGGQVWQRHGVTMMISMRPGDAGERGTVTFAEGRTTVPARQ